MGKLPDNFILTINPNKKDNQIKFLTDNKSVTKDIKLTYQIPEYNSTYYKNNSVNSNFLISTNTYYPGEKCFKVYNLSKNNPTFNFNASLLPLYKWYNQNYTLNYNILDIPYEQKYLNYKLSPSTIYASGNIAYDEIISGTTKSSDYKGLQVYYTSDKTSGKTYCATIPSDASGNFSITWTTYNPSSYVAGRITYLKYGSNTLYTLDESNNKPGAQFPSVPTFYIKTESYAIDSNEFDNWDDIGIYVIPAYYGNSGNSKCYCQIWDKSSGSGKFRTENELQLLDCIIFYPNPYNNTWNYYISGEVEGTCSRFKVRWTRSNYCPYMFKIIA